MHIRRPDTSQDWRAIMARLCRWGLRHTDDAFLCRDLHRLIDRRHEISQECCELIVADLARELLADAETVH